MINSTKRFNWYYEICEYAEDFRTTLGSLSTFSDDNLLVTDILYGSS